MVNCDLVSSGGVSEWFKEPVLKTGDPRKGTVGSNPTPSASILILNHLALWRSTQVAEEAPLLRV